ncbi:MAG: hypothetical protein AAF570_02640, partial [Bacteroidota bacterium]
GNLWTITDPTDSDQNPNPLDLDSTTAENLNKLNIAQLNVDECTAKVRSYQQQIYADWIKYMDYQYQYRHGKTVDPNGHDLMTLIDNSKAYIEAEIQKIDDLTSKDIAGYNRTITDLYETITKAVHPFVVQKVEAPRYYVPTDPVVLLSGADLAPAQRFGGDGNFRKDGYLACRTDDQLISNLTLKAGGPAGNSQDVSVGADAFETLIALPKVDGPDNDVLNAIIEEYFYLAPAFSIASATYFVQRGVDYSGLTKLLQQEAACLTGDGSKDQNFSHTGTAPSPVILEDWSGANPWMPISMDWSVNLLPVEAVKTNDYDSTFITKNFELDADDIDLKLTAQSLSGNSEQYTNAIVLNKDVSANLLNAIDKFERNYKDEKDIIAQLESLRDSLKNLNVMAQALNGFHEALTMRHEIFQLQISDPMAENQDDWEFTVNTVAPAVGDENSTAPLPANYYNPLRAGQLSLDRIRVVDAFGQFKDIKVSTQGTGPKVYFSQSLSVEGPVAANTGFFPPRLSQAARLQFRWLSAEDGTVEMNAHPATSPVCGYLLSNHLDGSLVFYDTNGGMIGSMYAVDEGSAVKWQGAPGTAYFGESLDKALGQSGINPELKALAEAVYGDGSSGAYLQDMLNAMDASLALVEPNLYTQSDGLGVFMGQPMALVRANVGLEILGMPACNQSYAAFVADGDLAANSPQYDVRQRTVNGFTEVEFPVRLGDLSDLQDGMAGFFMPSGSNADYSHFYSPGADSGKSGKVSVPAADTISVSPATDAQMITMLVDPRAEVHATTGFLPIKSINIPSDQFQQAIQNMEVAFLNAPVLDSALGLAFPKPFIGNRDWTFISNNGAAATSQWTETSIGKVDTSAGVDAYPQAALEGWLKLNNPETK